VSVSRLRGGAASNSLRSGSPLIANVPAPTHTQTACSARATRTSSCCSTSPSNRWPGLGLGTGSGRCSEFAHPNTHLTHTKHTSCTHPPRKSSSSPSPSRGPPTAPGPSASVPHSPAARLIAVSRAPISPPLPRPQSNRHNTTSSTPTPLTPPPPHPPPPQDRQDLRQPPLDGLLRCGLGAGGALGRSDRGADRGGGADHFEAGKVQQR
jgi:hypothetical protein